MPAPVHGPQEGLAFRVVARVLGARGRSAGQEIHAPALARVDVRPEFQVLVQALTAARVLLVAGPAHGAHLQDQVVAHAGVVAGPSLGDLAPFIERILGIAERKQQAAVLVSEAESAAELDHDIEVAARFTGRLDGPPALSGRGSRPSGRT